MVLHTLMGLLIPIIAIVFGCSIGLVAVITDYRRKKNNFELLHRERMAAIEKGLEVPPIPEEMLTNSGGPRRRRHPNDTFRRGLVWLFLGIALWFTLRATVWDQSKAWFGLPLVAIGLANLLYYAVLGRHEKPDVPKLPETKPMRTV